MQIKHLFITKTQLKSVISIPEYISFHCSLESLLNILFPMCGHSVDRQKPVKRCTVQLGTCSFEFSAFFESFQSYGIHVLGIISSTFELKRTNFLTIKLLLTEIKVITFNKSLNYVLFKKLIFI